MRPVTPAFLTTIRGSHTMAARVRVCSTFQTGVIPAGTDIALLGGAVTLDGTADIRSTVDLTTDGTAMWPDRAASLLAPYGNELFVERGVQYSDGVTEWCSLGYFRIQSPSQDRPPDGPIRITGQDRMAGLIDARLLAPRQFLATDTYGAVVSALVLEVYPLATVQWDDATSAVTLDRAVIVETERYAFLKDLVTSVGKIWYWDHRGILVITDAPVATAPVWDVNSGAGGVLVSMARTLTRERVYNAVVASGEAADTQAPVSAVAYNADPASPTAYSGRFGPVPMFYSSPFLTTTAQAQSAADAILRQQLGLPYAVSFAAVPNPALEPYDPVRVTYSQRFTSEVHVLQSVTVPLAEDQPVTATTREQTVILIGAL
jgi:hypothetical protein